MAIWGSGSLLPEKDFKTKRVQRQKMSLHMIGKLEMEMNLRKDLSMKGTLCLPAPSIGVPAAINIFL